MPGSSEGRPSSHIKAVAADSELALGPPLGERWDGREPRCLHLRGLRPVTPPGTLPLRGPAVRGPPDSPARGPLRPLGTALSGGAGYAPRWPEGSIWPVSCVAARRPEDVVSSGGASAHPPPRVLPAPLIGRGLQQRPHFLRLCSAPPHLRAPLTRHRALDTRPGHRQQ